MTDASDALEEIEPWLRQEHETIEQYDMFQIWLHSMDRNMAMFDDEKYKARGWSKTHAKTIRRSRSWTHRAWCYDAHVTRVETEELVRYRRQMLRKQRQVAQVAQSKVTQWLANLDPATLKPIEAAKWYELAVAVEQNAAGYTQKPGPADAQDAEQDPNRPKTLGDAMGVDPSLELDLSAEMHHLLQALGDQKT
jgi:hypothetical protein